MTKQTVALFDVAGTLVGSNPWEYVRQHPQVDEKRVKAALMRFLPVYIARKLKLVSDETFRDRWLRQMARLFEGWTRDQLQALFADIVQVKMCDDFFGDVLDQLRTHAADGVHVVLISGMFTDMTQAFADFSGAHAAIGTRLQFEGDRCTGRVDEPTCVGPRKLDLLRAYLNTQPQVTDWDASYAYADSRSDIPLLTSVGHSVVTHPDDDMRQEAQMRGWSVIPDSLDS